MIRRIHSIGIISHRSAARPLSTTKRGIDPHYTVFGGNQPLPREVKAPNREAEWRALNSKSRPDGAEEPRVRDENAPLTDSNSL